MPHPDETPTFHPVEAIDEIGAAIAAGEAHAKAHYAKHGTRTLIDHLSAEEFATWDGSDEMAIVSDSDGIDLDDDDFEIAPK